MKKTVSVNIKGINFLIEEDAYETLHTYLKRLEINLQSQEGAKDILEDIELRIAELCQEVLSDKKQVIEIEDITGILKNLGQPEDFIEDEDKAKFTNNSNEQSTYAKERRLYRDIDAAKIAGICSGLSNYLNVDVIVIRIIFLLFLFVGGFGVPLYIILWIVIPQANTSIDRLRMHGKPITVDSVKEEIEHAAERVNQSTKSFANRVRKDGSYAKRFTSIGNLITNIAGLVLLGFGALFLIVFIVFLFGGTSFIPIETVDGYLSFNELGDLLLSTENEVFLSWIGIILTALSVILFLISNGTYLLMKIRNKWSKLASLSLFILGLIGTIICVYIGSKVTREMISSAKMERNVLNVNTNTLIISTVNDQKIGEFIVNEGNNRPELKIQDNKIVQSGIKVLYKPSKDSLFHVYQVFSSHGSSYIKAISKAKNIAHSIEFKDSVLHVSPNYSFPKQDKIRAQYVKLIVEIPNNKTVKVNDKIINLSRFEEEELEKYGFIHPSGGIEIWD